MKNMYFIDIYLFYFYVFSVIVGSFRVVYKCFFFYSPMIYVKHWLERKPLR